ncbi:substrate-binding periplasmic protein [Aestuariispira insulae]|uniref:Amino acid ABC transporter substrate-binding protein (PAAT family) n=1 Tax=Aestuariispira insulae TaxID=1461337 RepID=A0A3D9HF07_9PROT|nr:transporter substrate-binding domain-containing protein [Aestuariispira insulae]RED48072.1 amino acid ABC transporter substrate-binding protein (PAAT family) [Aestuariispira insulae]
MRFLVIASFLSLISILSVSMAQAREFIVLATPQAPFKYLEEGTVRGIDADVLQLVMKQLGLHYKIRLINSGSRLLTEAKNGNADMLLLFSKKESRMSFLDYPDESYIDITWSFFIRKEDLGRIRFEQLSDLKGLRVGATSEYAYTPEFWAAGLNLDMVSNNMLQIRKLIAGRIDIVALNTINLLYDERYSDRLEKIAILRKPLTSKPYYNVFPKASSHPQRSLLLANYDAIIRSLQADGTIAKIKREYLGTVISER